jgi:hypothetical protein
MSTTDRQSRLLTITDIKEFFTVSTATIPFNLCLMVFAGYWIVRFQGQNQGMEDDNLQE